MTKVFEQEVGDALRRLSPGYVHKCPDIPQGPRDRVDFMGVLPNGRGFGIEAKETSNQEDIAASIITPNQRACLAAIHEAGGFAAAVINFDRVRGVTGRVGFCFAWLYIDIPWDSRFSVHRPSAILIPRVPGGWAIDEWLRRIL